MRMKFLLTALATVSLAGMSSAVMAQGQTSFHPVESWKVNNMSGGNNPANRCVLITEYNNGFYVQFQATAGKIELLSVDMRQDAFEAGSRMDVKLTIPGQPTAQLQAQAFDKQTLLVNLNGQDALFQNLRSGSAFDLNVDGNNFRFFMTGFANSLPVFDQCMGTASPAPAPMQEADVMPLEQPPATANIVETPVDIAEQPQVEMTPPAPEMQQEPVEALALAPPQDDTLSPMPVSEPAPVPVPASEQMASDAHGGEKSLADELADFVSSPEPAATPAASMQSAPVNDTVPQDADAMNMATLQARQQGQSASLNTFESDTIAPVMPMPGEEPVAAEPVDVAESAETLAMDDQNVAALEPEIIEPAIQEPPKKPSLRERLLGKKQEPAAVAALEVMPEEKPEVIQMSSPDMKINRQVAEGEFDLTDAHEVTPAPAVPPSFDNADTSELRKQVEMLRSENEALNTELKLALRAGEKERLDVSSKNWNLETATMRYNEAERQVANLGQQVQKERAQCSFEKKELEAMLFDPQVTNEAQLAHLAKLETQLQQARAEIDALRAGRGQ